MTNSENLDLIYQVIINQVWLKKKKNDFFLVKKFKGCLMHCHLMRFLIYYVHITKCLLTQSSSRAGLRSTNEVLTLN